MNLANWSLYHTLYLTLLEIFSNHNIRGNKTIRPVFIIYAETENTCSYTVVFNAVGLEWFIVICMNKQVYICHITNCSSCRHPCLCWNKPNKQVKPVSGVSRSKSMFLLEEYNNFGMTKDYYTLLFTFLSIIFARLGYKYEHIITFHSFTFRKIYLVKLCITCC